MRKMKLNCMLTEQKQKPFENKDDIQRNKLKYVLVEMSRSKLNY